MPGEQDRHHANNTRFSRFAPHSLMQWAARAAACQPQPDPQSDIYAAVQGRPDYCVHTINVMLSQLAFNAAPASQAAVCLQEV